MSEEKRVNFVGRRRFAPKGRGVVDEDREVVRRLLAGRAGGNALVVGEGVLAAEELIENLHVIQDEFGKLAIGHLAALAELMNLSYAAVYEVVTFYHHFAVVRDSSHDSAHGGGMPVVVRVCNSLSCELAGADALFESLRVRYGARIDLQTAPCVGRCADAPVAVVHQYAVGRADCAAVVAAVLEGKTRAVTPKGAQSFEDYRAHGGYAVYADCVAGRRQVEEVIALVEKSGLRGLGGAGFPAGRKWRIVREAAGEKVVAVNIDEGEPGTFKDRFYLEKTPHRFLEGALIAAWVVEAKAVYVYLRDEYHGCRALLEREIAALRREAEFALPRLVLRRGAGAYICGEESAMIESIEGKRGEPRLRPPYVAQVGVFGRPTLEHNMETLHWVPEIVGDGGGEGAARFAAGGRRGRSGMRSFSVSGRVAAPGVYRAPAGITVRELIDEFCGGMLSGHEFYGYLPGGASGGILPARMGDVPLDFDVIQEADGNCFIGSAAVIVLSDKDSARAAALNVMRFFADESCGQCTPCRVGTVKALGLMQAERWDVGLLEELAQVMGDTSICGLGQAAPNPVRCVIRHFAHEVS